MKRARPRSRRDMTGRLGLVGLSTAVLLGVVAYISFSANSGLPWERTYEVAVEVPNANRLIAQSDVRIAGTRVGRVADVEAVPAAGGRPAFARIQVSLERSVGHLARDTRARVRPASVLGASFLELEPGHSADTVPPEGVLRPPASLPTVDLTDLLDVFDRGTRAGFRQSVSGLAGGLRGRGSALGSTFSSTARLLKPLSSVSREVAAPGARLGPYLEAFDEATAAVAPVRSDLAGLLGEGATTLGAFAKRPAALRTAIERAAPAERATTRAFASVRPALRRLGELTRDLRPAGRRLAPVARDVTSILRVAQPVLRRIPIFSSRLESSTRELARLSRRPSTVVALKEVTRLALAIDETLKVLTPAQVHCNVIPLYAQNFGSAVGVMGTGRGPSLDLTGIASLGAENETLQNRSLSRNIAINYFPNADGNECESGNEKYDGTQSLNNPPGVQGTSSRSTTPPPGALDRARAAGLLEGSGR